MNTYECLLQQATDENISVYESYDLNGDGDTPNRLDGLYLDGNVALDKELKTTAKKACVLAEELGHYYTTVGNIIDLTDAGNRKQERQARLWAYNKQIGLQGIINAYKRGCVDCHEIAEYLEVTEEFLCDAIDCYREKYGIYAILDNYAVYFIPNLAVMEII